MDKFELQNRLKQFAFDVSKVVGQFPRNTIGRYIENQIIRSAFSAAANYRSACIAQSRASFIAKLSIAFEEIDESVFWLECIQHAAFLNEETIKGLMDEGIQLSKILGASRKNSR